MKLLVLNGPNLNLLGIREPSLYGSNSYADLVKLVSEYANEKGIEVSFFQSNSEGALVDALHKAYFDKIDGIVFNPAAYTHTSVALLDALKAIGIPTVEVHISDVSRREDFRQISYIRQAVIATIAGHGFAGYCEAVDLLLAHLQTKE